MKIVTCYITSSACFLYRLYLGSSLLFYTVFHLSHSHTMTPFDSLKIYSCRKHCEKRRNCLKQAISPFLTMFSILYDTYFSLSMHFKMSSAISFNLDQSKIFSSGNGLYYSCQDTNQCITGVFSTSI